MITRKTLDAVDSAEGVTTLDLANFRNLPHTASKIIQRAALENDKSWWSFHIEFIYDKIDEAIKSIDA